MGSTTLLCRAAQTTFTWLPAKSGATSPNLQTPACQSQQHAHSLYRPHARASHDQPVQPEMQVLCGRHLGVAGVEVTAPHISSSGRGPPSRMTLRITICAVSRMYGRQSRGAKRASRPQHKTKALLLGLTLGGSRQATCHPPQTRPPSSPGTFLTESAQGGSTISGQHVSFAWLSGRSSLSARPALHSTTIVCGLWEAPSTACHAQHHPRGHTPG